MARYGSSLKNSYIVYSPEPSVFQTQVWSERYIQGLSIDPAINHFAVSIERRYHNGVIVILTLLKYEFPAESIDLAAQGVYHSIYNDVTSVLNNLKPYYPECHYFVLERQPPIREDVMRVAQHALSYFLLHCSSLPLRPRIMEVNSKLKGKILGAPKGVKQAALKSWSENYGLELLTLRGDKRAIEIVKHTKKKNDLTDAINQFEALMIILGYPSTKDCINLCQRAVNTVKELPPKLPQNEQPGRPPVSGQV